MTPLLRLAEIALILFLVVWTVVFPLATMLSVMFTLPLVMLIAPRALRRVPTRA